MANFMVGSTFYIIVIFNPSAGSDSRNPLWIFFFFFSIGTERARILDFLALDRFLRN